MTIRKDEEVRRNVSDFYARSVQGKGCCGPTLPKGVAASLSGYLKSDLEGLPQDAAESSFGCGNPLAFAGVEKGQTVLDLGSGAGLDLLLAARRVGPEGRVIGVDMTEEMTRRAEATVREAGLTNVEVRQGIIEELPVESGSVDWVISNCVINLSPAKERVFAEIVRVLKPGGSLSVSDIVADSLPDWVLKNGELYSSCLAGAIPEADYCRGLIAAGLTDVKVAERLAYDREQLGALVGAPAARGSRSCCGGSGVGEVPDGGLEALVGTVWSARLVGRKGS